MPHPDGRGEGEGERRGRGKKRKREDKWTNFTPLLLWPSIHLDYYSLTVPSQYMSHEEAQISAVQTFCSLVSLMKIP